MNDITKHEWVSDSSMGEANISVIWCEDNCITLNVGNKEESLCSSIYRDDAIAMAKHFYDNLSTHDRLELINAIRGVTKLTITSRAQEVGSKHDFGNSVL